MEKEFEEIGILDIFKILYRDKIFIALFTSLISLTSIIVVLQLNDLYKSEATLFPQKKQGETSMNSRIGGLASLAGINLNSDSNDIYISIETIRSRQFHERLISSTGILENLMAASSYDKSSDEIVYNENIFDYEKFQWRPGKKPSFLETHSFLLDNLLIDHEKATGRIKISFKHYSPSFSKEFLDLVLTELNSQFIEKDLLESEKSLNYLNERFASSQVSSIKVLISSMLEDQLKKQMLIKFKEDYVFQVVDPPYLPEKKSEPKRTQIVIFFTLIGIFFGMMISLIRYFLYSKKTI